MTNKVITEISTLSYWYLYLLECIDGSIYTGIARDVQARFSTHQIGRGARYTRAHRPLRVLAVAQFLDRSTAQRAEYQVKQLSAQRKRAIAQQLCAGQSVTL
ncbi:MAG: GIY-YIG nuclease family protein [Ottowia sp.]|nr:GIY-YIG nuclease family protein [Ottowia sp.]